MSVQVFLTRSTPVAEVLERLLAEAERSVDAALYRLNHPRLARALAMALGRNVRVRLVLDRGKYEETPVTRELLQTYRIPFRLLRGRQGPSSKMHHKLALFDGRTALTGSYNWTRESEELNYECLLLLQEPAAVEILRQEFEVLWAEAAAPIP
jgi:phosphatidylserine/phosphatidylglycerophosphate/cardiolipin synthase-like enzyme